MLFIRTKIVSLFFLFFFSFSFYMYTVLCFPHFFGLFIESVVSFILISGIYLAAMLLLSHLAPDKNSPFDITRGRFLWTVDCSAMSPL